MVSPRARVGPPSRSPSVSVNSPSSTSSRSPSSTAAPPLIMRSRAPAKRDGRLNPGPASRCSCLDGLRYQERLHNLTVVAPWARLATGSVSRAGPARRDGGGRRRRVAPSPAVRGSRREAGAPPPWATSRSSQRRGGVYVAG
jgi:hypothetical protein